MTSLQPVDKDFPEVLYPLLDSHPKLDSLYSDSGRIIPEGGLAEDDIPVTNIIPKDKTTSTIPVDLPQPSSITSTFSFLVSFEKFHVTTASKAGSNKIYECRRSKSFFFEVVDQIPGTNDIHLKIYTNDYKMSSTPIRYRSTSKIPNHRFQISKCLTHFFLHQKVIPRRIQNKFFNMIRLKLLDRINFIRSREQKIGTSNNSTKTFFNFSYKRYRFYFGIYIACNHCTPPHNSNHRQNSVRYEIASTNTIKCSIPCPFVRNCNRHACARHHSLMKDILPTDLDKKLDDRIRQSIPNYKSYHANLCFERFYNRVKKEIFSNRLGITYTSQYVPINFNLIAPPNKLMGFMYKKKQENFRFTYSSNPRTAARQCKRFDRACRRTFNKYNHRADKILNGKLKGIIANRSNFLCYPHQSLRSQIRHLKFNGSLFKAKSSVAPFRFPYDKNRKLWNLPDESNTTINEPPVRIITGFSIDSNATRDESNIYLHTFTRDKSLKSYNAKHSFIRYSHRDPILREDYYTKLSLYYHDTMQRFQVDCNKNTISVPSYRNNLIRSFGFITRFPAGFKDTYPKNFIDDTTPLAPRPNKRRSKFSHYCNNSDFNHVTKKIHHIDVTDSKEGDFLPTILDLYFDL